MRVFVPFDPWKSQLCSCPSKYSLSPYIGCGHGCLYCYASSYIRNFRSVREKKNFLLILQKEIKKIEEAAYITMANSSDPYLPQEESLKLTRDSLKILLDYNVKLMIVTKSSLVLRDLDILKKFKNIVVSFSITSLNEKLSKKLEPFAPSPCERITAIEKLSRYINVVCRLDPLIYPLNTEEISKIIKEVVRRGVKQIITSTYKVRWDNFKRMVSRFPEYRNVWHKLYIVQGERKKGYLYLPARMRYELINRVRENSLMMGVKFSSCREGLNYLNTAVCDGSAFFKK